MTRGFSWTTLRIDVERALRSDAVPDTYQFEEGLLRKEELIIWHRNHSVTPGELVKLLPQELLDAITLTYGNSWVTNSGVTIVTGSMYCEYCDVYGHTRSDHHG